MWVRPGRGNRPTGPLRSANGAVLKKRLTRVVTVR
jgi:hypothetical protein